MAETGEYRTCEYCHKYRCRFATDMMLHHRRNCEVIRGIKSS